MQCSAFFFFSATYEGGAMVEETQRERERERNVERERESNVKRF